MPNPTVAPIRRKQIKETVQELYYDHDDTLTVQMAGSYYGTVFDYRVSRVVLTWTETQAGDNRTERVEAKAYGRAIKADGGPSLTERVIKEPAWTDELRSELARQTERNRPRG